MTAAVATAARRAHGRSLARRPAVLAGLGIVPDLILFAQTYDGRDALARLSVKLDRPVVTNGLNVTVDGDTVRIGVRVRQSPVVGKSETHLGHQPGRLQGPDRARQRAPRAPRRSAPRSREKDRMASMKAARGGKRRRKGAHCPSRCSCR